MPRLSQADGCRFAQQSYPAGQRQGRGDHKILSENHEAPAERGHCDLRPRPASPASDPRTGQGPAPNPIAHGMRRVPTEVCAERGNSDSISCWYIQQEDEPSGMVHVAIRARLRISRVSGLYTVARLTQACGLRSRPRPPVWQPAAAPLRASAIMAAAPTQTNLRRATAADW